VSAVAFLLCVTVVIPSIPDVISRLRSGTPVWVSAHSAFGRNGDLRAELFWDHAAEFLKQSLSKNADRCNAYVGAPVFEDFTPKDSLDALAGYSLTIVKARVVAAGAGFDNGTPGTLFALRVDETYKSIGQTATSGPLYLFITETTIPTAKGFLCSKSFSPLPLPAVGDDVIVFCSVDPIDDEQRILHIDESHQFVLQHAGRLYLPRLNDDPLPPNANIDDLGARIRANPHLHDFHPRVFSVIRRLEPPRDQHSGREVVREVHNHHRDQ
jgi:hypothetical protein